MQVKGRARSVPCAGSCKNLFPSPTPRSPCMQFVFYRRETGTHKEDLSAALKLFRIGRPILSERKPLCRSPNVAPFTTRIP
jgi:hypothetical protein